MIERNGPDEPGKKCQQLAIVVLFSKIVGQVKPENKREQATNEQNDSKNR